MLPENGITEKGTPVETTSRIMQADGSFEDRESAAREVKRVTDLLDLAYKDRLAGA
ncbi:MAG: hypothetical protein Q8R78_05440 [Candidatus Omnitrophota bacterium]|nr:hypothetical protein [Candidatus Omnitrophota bacterium]